LEAFRGTARNRLNKTRPRTKRERRRAHLLSPINDALDLCQNRPDAIAPSMLLRSSSEREGKMGVIWTIIIGFIVGVIAKFIMPGDKTEPKGFILTAILGIVGAFIATYLGQSVGWYRSGESAGILGGVVGAAVLLFAYGIVAGGKRA
jgi:uncharacterized membrane protein YeaQ/YmgE (transglycosylase-associated protein family)